MEMPPKASKLASQYISPRSSANELKIENSTIKMCEQIIKYDCGHMCRRTIPCTKQQPKHNHSVTCFSGLSHSYEQDHHETAKLERRATLCPMCEAKGKDRETYQNGIRRASAPRIEAKQHPTLDQENDKSTMSKVSTSISRSNSTPGKLPSQRLRRVRDTGNSSLRNEYNRLESPRNEGFEGHRERRHRPRNITTQGPELDWFASGYVPLYERTPTSPTSFTGLLDYGQSRQNLSSLSLVGLSRSNSVLKRLQKGLQRKSSDESFVCSSAREVERGGG